MIVKKLTPRQVAPVCRQDQQNYTLNAADSVSASVWKNGKLLEGFSVPFAGDDAE